MKKGTLFLFALALGACGEGPSTTDPMVEPQFAKPVAQDHQVNVPIEGSLYHPCTSEYVEVSGTAHVNITTFDDGGTIRQRIHLNTQGISGISDEGTRYNYIVVQKGAYEFVVDYPGYPWSQSVDQKVLVITSGKGSPNYVGSLSVETGVDADGNYFYNLDRYSETCR